MAVDRKFVISPSTIDKNKLTNDRKKQLREERILDYIKRVDAKRPVSVVKELPGLINLSEAQTHRIVKDLVESGRLVREQTREIWPMYIYRIGNPTSPSPIKVAKINSTPAIEKSEVLEVESSPTILPVNEPSALVSLIKELAEAGLEINIRISK